MLDVLTPIELILQYSKPIASTCTRHEMLLDIIRNILDKFPWYVFLLALGSM